MIVFNLPRNTPLHVFEAFLTQQILEMHDERVDIIKCELKSTTHASQSVRVEFLDSRQRNFALSITGVFFYNRQLRAEEWHSYEIKPLKKQRICPFFFGGQCNHMKCKERCWNAHGVLDLRLCDDTQLHCGRCFYINQIDTSYSSSNLLNFINVIYSKHQQGSRPIITALYHRQEMGDAVIEFANPTFLSKARQSLNGVKLGSKNLAIHAWASGYQEIFIKYFDENIQIEIKVQRETPPIVLAALPRHNISPVSSEDIGEATDPPQVERYVRSERLGPRLLRNDSDNIECFGVEHDRRQMDCDTVHHDNCSETTSSPMASTDVISRLAPVRDETTALVLVEDMESPQKACQLSPQAGSMEQSESCDTRENAASDYSESAAPLQSAPPLDTDKDGDQEENDRGALVLPNVRPLHESSTLARSQDQDIQAEENLPAEDGTSPQEGSTETIQEEPGYQEAPESQQDENNHVELEPPNELMKPLHVLQDDHVEIERIVQENANLMSENLQKDYLIESLKQENNVLKEVQVKLESQLEVSLKDARIHLEKLVDEKKRSAKMEEEVERLRRENNNLLPQLKIKEEQTKQLKTEVYDLLKIRCDVFTAIKKLCGQMDRRIKSDQAKSMVGGDPSSEDQDANEVLSSTLSSTVLEVKRTLEGASSNMERWESHWEEIEAENQRLREENEQLQDEKSALEEELQQRLMGEAMERGFAGDV